MRALAKLDQLITYLFAALFFFVPIILWPKTSEVFEFNKMMFAYLLVSFIFSAFVAKSILQGRISIKRTPLDFVLILFLLSQILSTVFSIDPHTSIWGYYSRFHGGLMSTITYIVLFYLLITHLLFTDQNSRQAKFSILTFSILSSATLVSVYGILERLGIDKHIWVQDVQNRVFSTLGQPNWLSAYLAALLPLPIYFSLQSKNKTQSATYFLTALCFLVTILFTKSRSGIATSFIVLFLIFLQQSWGLFKNKINKKFILICLTFFTTFILIGTPWTPNPKQINERLDLGGPIWSEVEPHLNKIGLTTQIKPLEISRLPQQTQEIEQAKSEGKRVGGSDSFEIRRVVWQGAIDLLKKRPLIGTGVETFAYSYYWTRPMEHNLLSEWDFLYNKAHNEYLNFLATTGTFGGVSYLLVILASLSLFVHLLRQTPRNYYVWPLFLGFISILITNYFGFSVVPVAIFFFTFPALAQASTDTANEDAITIEFKKAHKKQKDQQPSFKATVALLLLGIGQLFVIIIIFRHWQADLNYTQGKRYASAGYLAEAITYLEKAEELYPQEPVYKAQLAEAQATAALTINQKLETLPATTSANIKESIVAKRNEYAAMSLEKIDQTLNLNPWHLNFLKSKAKIELTIGTYDPEYLERALHTLLAASQLAPTDAKILYHIAVVYETMNQDHQAISVLEKTLQFKNDYQQARTDLIELYLKTEQIDKAKTELPKLLLDFPNHPLQERPELKT